MERFFYLKMNSDEDEQTFAETVMENMNLANIYYPVSESPMLFLRRDKRVFVRSVTVDEAERDVWLQNSFDIDGCVIELKNLNGIRMPVRHITLFPNDNGSLREIRSTLKKHINLTEYSKSELMNFSSSLGFQLFYERGWECWVAMIPVHKQGFVAFPKQIIRQQTFNTFLELRRKFKDILADYAMNGIASKPTSGLQELIGLRCVLSTCLSLTDCGNFPSNLDGRPMDIKNGLRRFVAFRTVCSTLCRYTTPSAQLSISSSVGLH